MESVPSMDDMMTHHRAGRASESLVGTSHPAQSGSISWMSLPCVRCIGTVGNESHIKA